MKQFLNEDKIVLVEAAAVAGTADLESDSIDMAQGYEGVVFFGTIATKHADNYIKGQQSDDDGVADGWSDLEGSKVAALVNGDIVALEVFKPAKRYVRIYVERGGASTATGDFYAIAYRSRVQPVNNNVSGDIVSVKLITPDEGTA